MAVSSPGILDTSGIPEMMDAFIVIVRTSWNSHVVDLLEKGCLEQLAQKKVRTKTIVVPGAVEITFAIKNYWERQERGELPHAFIALGCVIRGDTPHFEYVCNAVTQGVVQLNLLLPVPTIFGILTVNDQAQADERTGGSHGHKGEEAAATALKMISLSQS
ncbi:MAG TPA: 6,7-dimethyl-8-ribityllumazine synthase [Ferruginibacter sp.]|nr:6,7-dimethyl-8-ribityllumazine synthase [Ferruginibacter sp.]